MNNPDRFDMKKWKRQNLLGYTSMMVRDKLIGKYKNGYME